MLQSRGAMVLIDSGATNQPRGRVYLGEGASFAWAFASYAELYRRQLWVSVLVSKLGGAVARLPLKAYRRTDEGREAADDSPLGTLLRRPNPRHDRTFFWLWMASTYFLNGETMAVKVREAPGETPVELWPLHPSNVELEPVVRPDGTATGRHLYVVRTGRGELVYDQDDIIHIKDFNPDSTLRGMSKCEPLRQTLENEWMARRANSAFWRRGARPGTVLSHPKTISQPAQDRLRAQIDAIAGADGTGSTVVLEEGMEPKKVDLSAEEAQYIDSRKLNREECCAAWDVPPPVVHILDRATFSNITEQMRSMYRDTMGSKLPIFEQALQQQLVSEFGEDLYVEFLLDEVLRGDFEQRAEAQQKAINSGQLTPNEARRMENRPPVDGGDVLLINGNLIPIDQAGAPRRLAIPAASNGNGNGSRPEPAEVGA